MALLLALPFGSGPAAPPPEPQELAAAGPVEAIYVQFRFRSPDASDVALAGSFTDWRPSYPMQRNQDGTWTVLLPITPGVHDYAFVVDGERWVADPYAPEVDDGFGGVNSRLTLLAPGQAL